MSISSNGPGSFSAFCSVLPRKLCRGHVSPSWSEVDGVWNGGFVIARKINQEFGSESALAKIHPWAWISQRRLPGTKGWPKIPLSKRTRRSDFHWKIYLTSSLNDTCTTRKHVAGYRTYTRCLTAVKMSLPESIKGKIMLKIEKSIRFNTRPSSFIFDTIYTLALKRCSTISESLFPCCCWNHCFTFVEKLYLTDVMQFNCRYSGNAMQISCSIKQFSN